MNEQGSILLIERDGVLGPVLRSIMLNHDTEVRIVRDPDAALPELMQSAARAACILIAADSDQQGALRLLRLLRKDGCPTPIIIAVHSWDDETEKEFLGEGATDVVGIPLVYAFLMNRVEDFTTGEPTSAPHMLTLRDGTEVAFRFLHPADADIEQAFVRGLSPQSRYMRFFTFFKELPPEFLKVFTHNEFPRSYAVIATVRDGGKEVQIGVARYAPTSDAGTAEFAVVVADQWQRCGLASKLMHIVIVAAAIAGYSQLEGVILRENTAMLGLARKLGFKPIAGGAGDPGVIRVRKSLTSPPLPGSGSSTAQDP